MEKDEKVRFILEQMRLCLAKKDFIRTQIISKKISVKYFTDESDLVQVSRSFIIIKVYHLFCGVGTEVEVLQVDD